MCAHALCVREEGSTALLQAGFARTPGADGPGSARDFGNQSLVLRAASLPHALTPSHSPSPSLILALIMDLLVCVSSFTGVSLWSPQGDRELLGACNAGRETASKQMTTAPSAKCTREALLRGCGSSAAGGAGARACLWGGWGWEGWTKRLTADVLAGAGR